MNTSRTAPEAFSGGTLLIDSPSLPTTNVGPPGEAKDLSCGGIGTTSAAADCADITGIAKAAADNAHDRTHLARLDGMKGS